MSSRSIKTDEVQLHGWTPTCTPSHSEDKQLHQCPVRKVVLLLDEVFCGRGIHVGAESLGPSLCSALSTSAVYRAGILRQQLSKWLCDLCGCNPKSCVTWKVLAQSAAVITLLLLQHEACNQCLTTSVRTTSRPGHRIHRLQHEPTFQGFGLLL